MVDNLNKLATIFTKIRTPLSLAGLVILVLYAVYRQILSLKIFPTLSETSASVLLNGLVTGLFWLALVAIVLGVVSHFLSVFFKPNWQGKETWSWLINSYCLRTSRGVAALPTAKGRQIDDRSRLAREIAISNS